MWRLSISALVRLPTRISTAKEVYVCVEGAHTTALDVGQCAREIDAGPVVEQGADDKGAVRHA